MSNPPVLGGFSMPIIIVVLGVLGLFDIVFFFAFVGVLGYYLYKLEKRTKELESRLGESPKPSQG